MTEKRIVTMGELVHYKRNEPPTLSKEELKAEQYMERKRKERLEKEAADSKLPSEHDDSN